MTCKGFLAICVCMAAAAAVPTAQAVLNVDWYSINAGGATATGGTLVVHGTAGQADAHEVSGGSYVLTGGFRVVSHCAVSDANEDGSVDVGDLLDLVFAFGAVRGDSAYYPPVDFNADGSVDVLDLLLLVEQFGT